jgi:hypothetical protein
MKKLSKTARPGVVVGVKLHDGTYTFGVTLTNLDVTFFNYRSHELPKDLAFIVKQPVAFRVCMAHQGLRTYDWLNLGNVAVPVSLDTPRVTARRPVFSDKIYVDNYPELSREISEAVARTLERSSVWSPVHVEARLEKYFAGDPRAKLVTVFDDSVSFTINDLPQRRL